MKRLLKWTFRIVLVLLLVGFLLGFVAYWSSTNDCNRNAASSNNPIKAIVNCEYGIENLQLRELEKPSPNDNEVLVRVRAASINPVDGHLIRGSWMMRPMSGLRKPKNTRFGTDFAGTIDAVGKNVTNFKPGDEVFGAKNGAVAEYVCVKADKAVVLKPANITFEQAGSVAVAGLTALQGLRDKGHIQSGQKVLINGASGGVGTFAVQIAKAFGAEVTGVCSTRNVDLVKSIGADRVIDYTKEDFTRTDQRYDMIYDLVGNHSFSERRQILTANGICVLAGIGGAGLHPESGGRILGVFTASLRSRFVREKFVTFGVSFNTKDLGILRDLTESGKVVPAVTKTYSFTESAAAYKYLATGHARGKIVITVE